eukprot:TRINITY_DN13079_c0_g1_i1.p1 TRINITY_DN13079_c0_g1~~TRINITY_DN13079_c0_g1_i1.p1  ORF type:complete len:447 (-),score=115.40 TRINITY_DN13079_c0_g1_i1:315-1655(-)
MGKMSTDSPLSRCIVAAFIQFLDSVKPASGIDTEGIEVAKDCLIDVFGPDLTTELGHVRPNLLLDLFKSAESDTKGVQEPSLAVPPSSWKNDVFPSAMNSEQPQTCNGDDLPVEAGVEETGTSNVDELFEQFREGLENAGFFAHLSVGSPEYMESLQKARDVLKSTLKEMKTAESSSELDSKVLAEAFKVQGNSAMSLKRYREAIELYTLSISLCCHNAVYYCNRAAAHTQVGNYNEAIEDCKRAIEIDPNYSKAYSRLGLVYYAQGNYQDAIQKGFQKALEIDPNNSSVRDNIKMAKEKLENHRQNDAQTTGEGGQNSQSTGRSRVYETNGTSSTTHGSQFTSMPFDASFPPEIANVLPGFMSMAAEFGNNINDRHHENSTEDTSIRTDNIPRAPANGNINLTFDGAEMPENIGGFMQSMFQMLSGQGNQQRNPQERPHEERPSN